MYLKNLKINFISSYFLNEFILSIIKQKKDLKILNFKWLLYNTNPSLSFWNTDDERELFNFLQTVKHLSKAPIVIFFFKIKSQRRKSSFVFKFGNLIFFVINFFLSITVDNPISHERSN